MKLYKLLTILAVLLGILIGMDGYLNGYAVCEIAHSAELPEMSYYDQRGFLAAFPLDKVTAMEVISAYGPPQNTVTGLPNDGAVWTYYETKDSVIFMIQFENGTVKEIVNRWPNGFFGKSERKATEVQQ